MADQYTTEQHPRYVAGSMGPTTKLPSLGHVSFDVMKACFTEQALGLLAGNVDLFIIETCQDVLQIKAALTGVEEAFSQTGERRPLMVSVTMETTGTMLVGSDVCCQRIGFKLIYRFFNPLSTGRTLRRQFGGIYH